MHSCSVQTGNKWLQANLDGVLTSSWFTNGGTVIVTMDESNSTETVNNEIPMVVISNNAKGHGNLALSGNHFVTLGTLETAYGLPLLGKAKLSSVLEALFG